MSQKTYMYDTQWQALINAIDGGDTSAIATALGQIKTSIDSIETALGSLSTDVTQDSTQWTNLINAISSGGGGGGGTIDIDATQWSDLLTEIGKGDMTATATALNNIYNQLNSIGFNSTQWTNLINAITNQSLTVDLSNITSSVVSNLSNVSGSTLTDALNALNSTLSYNPITWTPTSPRATISSSDCRYIKIGCLVYFFGSITFSATQTSQQALYLGLPSNMNIINSSVFGGTASSSDHYFDLRTRGSAEGRLYLYDSGSIVYSTNTNIAGKQLLLGFVCIVSS